MVWNEVEGLICRMNMCFRWVSNKKCPVLGDQSIFVFVEKDGHRPSLYIYKRRVWTYFLSDLMIPSRMCVSAWIFCNL